MASEAPYAALSALFWAGLLTAARAGRRELAEPTSAGDLLALGLAAAKIGDVVAEDRVTVFLRRPFADGPAAVRPAGEGTRRAVGELLTCAHCVSLWAAGALAVGQLARPRETRLVARVFAALAIADAVRSRRP
ncbi:MAG TPA: DUF1360 domain-containing protein [Gaiellaceae bacterium]|nr:DUF1360 domain-containing protein [Gaiellaceae bacterium]